MFHPPPPPTSPTASSTPEFLTDVFEDDPHSPLAFHTRVLGFERIGSHRFGELRRPSRRIILMLDVPRAYERLRHKRNRVVRALRRRARGGRAPRRV